MYMSLYSFPLSVSQVEDNHVHYIHSPPLSPFTLSPSLSPSPLSLYDTIFTTSGTLLLHMSHSHGKHQVTLISTYMYMWIQYNTLILHVLVLVHNMHCTCAVMQSSCTPHTNYL